MQDAIIWLCEALVSQDWHRQSLAEAIGTITFSRDDALTVQPALSDFKTIVIIQDVKEAHPTSIRIMLASTLSRDELMGVFGDYTHLPLGASNALMFRLNHPDYPGRRLSVVAEGNDNQFHSIIVGLSIT